MKNRSRNIAVCIMAAFLIVGGVYFVSVRVPAASAAKTITFDQEKAHQLVVRGEFGMVVQELLPKFEAIDSLPGSSEDKNSLAYLLALALQGSGDWNKSIEVLETMRPLTFQDDKKMKLSKAKMLAAMGEAHRVLKADGKALVCFSDSAELFEKVDMNRSLGYVSVKNSWAVLLLSQGKFDEAETMLQAVNKALDTVEPKSDMSRVLRSKCLGNLGLISKNKGELTEAMRNYQESISLRSEVQGAESPNMIMPYYNLGMLYATSKKYGLAREYVGKAVTIASTIWPADSKELILMRRNLSVLKKYP